jgi:hypothetical protein
MKTIIITLIALLISLGSSGQYMDIQRTSFGILGGVNFQNLNGEDNEGERLENKLIVGFHAGLNVQIPLVPDFYIQPGLLFTTKGGKNEGNLVNGTYRLSYIELPLNFVYKGLLGNGYVMVGFGPYVAYGIAGNAEFEGGSVSMDSKIEFKNTLDSDDPYTTTYFKPFDAGANIFAGYEMMNGIFLQLNTQLGMLNINPEDNRLLGNNSVIKNTGFGLSAGFRF